MDEKFSERLVTLVQVVFAVVIGESLMEFHEVLFPPQNSVAFWALVGVYITSIMSWTGYHARMNAYPYTHTRLGILRVICDVLIVILYAFLLFAGTQGRTIEWYLWGFSIVFLLYIASGLLRRTEHRDPNASNIPLLMIFLGIFVLLSSVFTILIRLARLDIILLNWIFVFPPTVTMVIYRLWNEWKKRKWRN